MQIINKNKEQYFYISGSWYLVHLLRLFPVTKVITQYFGSELVVSDKQLFLKEEMFEKNNFQSIIEKLYNKINNLEDQVEKPVRVFISSLLFSIGKTLIAIID